MTLARAYKILDSSNGLPPAFPSGLGPNVVVNGGFDTDLTGWTVTNPVLTTVEVVAGRLHIVTDGSGAGVRQDTLTTGRNYQVDYDYEAVSGSLKSQLGSSGFSAGATQHVTYIENNVTSEALFLFRNSGAAEGFFDNISIREVMLG